MKDAAFARLNSQSGLTMRIAPHDVREWLRRHTQEIRDDLTPRAPPGIRGVLEKRLKAWSDGLPAADRELSGGDCSSRSG